MILWALGSLLVGTCTNTGSGTECVCSAANPCPGPTVTCTDDVDCDVVCVGTGCDSKVVQCPEWGVCTVTCKKCTDVEVRCPQNTLSSCVVECLDCTTTAVVPSTKGDVRCSLCDADTIAAAFGTSTGAACTSPPPSAGPDALLAYASCPQPTTHGLACSSDTSVCEDATVVCTDGAWSPALPVQCGILPYDCGADPSIHRLIRPDMSCGSFAVTLSAADTVGLCAKHCSETPGCKYFSFSADECKWQQTQSDACVEGFTPWNSSFYKIVPAVPPCNGNGDCTTQGCICYASAATGFWDSMYCNMCTDGYATAECNVPCSGGACHKCSGHGWCSEGTAGDGSCVCSDGWEPPSCSSCAADRFGMDCRGVCPAGTGLVCSDHGECDAGRTGTGECLCNDGWASPLCDTCDDQHWGHDCSGECPGGGTCSGHGACSQNNGTCTCDPAWGGTACELACSCSGHGECVALDPPCECEMGWALPDCSTCEDGYGGPDCATLCPGTPFCSGHGTCDASVACACDPDWYDDMGVPCSVSCPQGLSETVCSGHGVCDGPAQNFTCSCNTNWDGDDCSQCLEGFSGVDCGLPCPSANGDVCNSRGSCLNGTCYCSQGCGTACEEDVCPSSCSFRGVFNANCTGECPGFSMSLVCAGHGECNDGRTGDGTCTCSPRGEWGGPYCDVKCPSVSALPCSGNGVCDIITSTCVCDGGYVGGDCSGVCPRTASGICGGKGTCNSSAVCECEAAWGGSACNVFCGCVEGRGRCNTTGECVCSDNFSGVTCRECATGLHGDNCTEQCVHGTSIAQRCKCDSMWSGQNCDHPCPGLLTGNACNGKGTCLWGGDRAESTCVCLPDWYGEDCSRQCTADMCGAMFPFGSAICDEVTGGCVCDERHKGPLCSECSDQFWGSYCDQPCRCVERGSCDRATGECTCYNEPSKGYFAGDLCQYCGEGWTGLPLCTTKNTPMTLHNTPSSSVKQSSLPTLLFEDKKNSIAWIGGDPPVLFDLVKQTLGGTVMLDACPIVKGWEFDGKVFLLADVCRLHGQPRLLRVTLPPSSATDWDGRSGTPLCTALSSEVCLVSVMEASRVVSATWEEGGPLVVATASGAVTLVWLDPWGVAEGTASFVSNISVPTATASVGAVQYYVCGLISVAPGWACEGFHVGSVGMYNLTGRLQWISGAPSCVALAAVVGTAGTLYISLGFTPPGGTAVGVVRHLCTAAECTVVETEVVDTSRSGVPSVLAYDQLTNAVYSSTCGSRSCSLSRIANGSVASSTELSLAGVGAMLVDDARRVVYVLPHTTNTELYVMSAFCSLDVSPSTVYSGGGTLVTLSGFGYSTVADSETETTCYFGGVPALGTVVSKGTVTCTAPSVSAKGCSQDTVELAVFDPVGAVPPYISSCNVPYTPRVHPRLIDVTPYHNSLLLPTEILVGGRGFLASPDLRCRFDPDGVVTVARYFNTTHVGCMPPTPGSTSVSTVTVSLDGQNFAEPGVPVVFVGAAVRLEAVIAESVVRSEVPVMTVPVVDVYTIDEAGNKLLGYDNTTRTLYASLLWYHTADSDVTSTRPQYLSFAGDLTAEMTSGHGTFTNLTLREARAANASFAFATPGLEGALTTVLITAGVPYAFIFLKQPYPKIEQGTGRLIPGNSTAGSDTPVVGLIDVLGSRLTYLGTDISITFATQLSEGHAAVDAVKATHTILPSDYDMRLAQYGTEYVFNITSPSHPSLVAAVSEAFTVEDCPDGSYMDKGCLACPVGGVCNGSHVIEPREGYWRGGNSTNYYKCAENDACPVGSACSSGTTGPVCGSCREGWVDDGTGCEECIHMLPVVLAFILYVAVTVILYVVWAAYLAVPLYTGANNRSDALHGILLASGIHFQCDGLVGMLPVLPDWLRHIYLWEYRLTTGDVVHIPIISCLVRESLPLGHELYFGAVYYLLMPVQAALLAGFATLFVYYKCRMYTPPAGSGSPKEVQYRGVTPVSYKKMLVLVGVMVWFVQCMPMQVAVENLLQCREFDGVERLRRDTVMPCEVGWNVARGLVWVYLGLCVVLVRDKGNILFGFVTGGLDRAGWVVGALLRRVVVVATVLGTLEVRGKLINLNLLSFIMLVGTAFFTPWKGHDVCRHDTYLLAMSTLTTQLALQYTITPHWAIPSLILFLKIATYILVAKQVHINFPRRGLAKQTPNFDTSAVLEEMPLSMTPGHGRLSL